MLLFRATENGYVLFFAFPKLQLGLFRVILLFFCLDLRVKGPLGLNKAKHIVYKLHPLRSRYFKLYRNL